MSVRNNVMRVNECCAHLCHLSLKAQAGNAFFPTLLACARAGFERRNFAQAGASDTETNEERHWCKGVLEHT